MSVGTSVHVLQTVCVCVSCTLKILHTNCVLHSSIHSESVGLNWFKLKGISQSGTGTIIRYLHHHVKVTGWQESWVLMRIPIVEQLDQSTNIDWMLEFDVLLCTSFSKEAEKKSLYDWPLTEIHEPSLLSSCASGELL